MSKISPAHTVQLVLVSRLGQSSSPGHPVLSLSFPIFPILYKVSTNLELAGFYRENHLSGGIQFLVCKMLWQEKFLFCFLIAICDIKVSFTGNHDFLSCIVMSQSWVEAWRAASPQPATPTA